MLRGDSIWKFPELAEFLETVRSLRTEIINAKRPPEQVLLDDVDFRELLKISKRTAAGYREQGIITYSKVQGKIFYKLSDILEFVDSYKIPTIQTKLKIKL